MVKKILFLVCFFIATFSHAQHVIHGRIEHSEIPHTVYLKKFFFNWVVLDSVRTENNEFTFTVPENNDFIYIDINNEDKSQIKLYNVKGITSIYYNSENQNLHITGTSVNEGLYQYQAYLKPFEKKLQVLIDNPPNIPVPQQASAEEQVIYKNHMKNVADARKSLEQAKFDFIKNNKENDYAKLLIEERLQKDFYEKDWEVLKRFYKELDKSSQQSERGRKLNSFLKDHETIQIGFKVNDFKIPDVNNKEHSLYKNLGKYTILDFWSSSCGPCRKENPHLVKIYDKYKRSGLNIVGISLDVHKEQWINAITKDGLTWLQLSNLKHTNDPIAALYKITAIPRMFILDHKGTIIARDLYGEELDKKLEELFKEK